MSRRPSALSGQRVVEPSDDWAGVGANARLRRPGVSIGCLRPEAQEPCVYFGRIRGGKLEAFLAGLGFMLPGFLLLLTPSVLYVEANLAEHLDQLFYGLKAAVGAEAVVSACGAPARRFPDFSLVWHVPARGRWSSSDARDRRADSGLTEWLHATMVQGTAPGPAGWVDDDLAFAEPWGFDLRDIAVPVLVVHGRQDRFVPVSHGEFMAGAIPRAEARIDEWDGHLTLIAHRVPAVLDWLRERLA